MVQWLRICLPVQGTGVHSLVQEDFTCCGATQPVSHSGWARVRQAPQLRRPRAVFGNQRSHQKQPACTPRPERSPARGGGSLTSAAETQRSQNKGTQVLRNDHSSLRQLTWISPLQGRTRNGWSSYDVHGIFSAVVDISGDLGHVLTCSTAVSHLER